MHLFSMHRASLRSGQLMGSAPCLVLPASWAAERKYHGYSLEGLFGPSVSSLSLRMQNHACSRMHFANVFWGWGGIISWTCAHGTCYALVTFLELAHMLHPTVGGGRDRDVNVPWACTHRPVKHWCHQFGDKKRPRCTCAAMKTEKPGGQNGSLKWSETQVLSTFQRKMIELLRPCKWPHITELLHWLWKYYFNLVLIERDWF